MELTYIENKVNDIGPWVWSRNTCSWEWQINDWEIHEKKWFTHVKNFNVCVQAGGATGLYPRLLSERFNRVYTFEPDYENFYCLVNNCPSEKIIKIQAALGCRRGLTDFTRDLDIAGSGYVREEIQANPTIPMMMIDDLELPEVNLLALDVENYESYVLKGAVETINRCKPVIICEHGELVKDYLKGLDYIVAEGSAYDTIFIPKE